MGNRQAYGAGLLSSFGELEHACAKVRTDGTAPPEYRPWDPFAACKQKYPITTYQPVYYVAESMASPLWSLTRWGFVHGSND
jgi:phenylalanine-4-hydroxylase